MSRTGQRIDPDAERLGAVPRADGSTAFLVWAPAAQRVEVELLAEAARRIALEPLARGYHGAAISGVGAGARYRLVLDGGDGVPDPASRAQPEGVHGPSEVVDLARDRPALDGWSGIAMEDLVVYELHVGTFSAAGTFDAIVPRLPALKELGITAIELLPIAQFPGARNWGYDGVQPFAVQDSYGGVQGLRRLVDACHREGIGVLVDVVYNHFGPEGNYLGKFGPYFTDHYRTPWGSAINFDKPGADEVRRYFVEHALFLVEDCGVDGLRLDATHAIHDRTAMPFLEEITRIVHERAAAAGRHALMIAESNQNDPRYVQPAGQGFGMDGFWSDDLHHALHVALTGERDGYYVDFDDLDLLARAWAQGLGYQGQRSRYRGRRQGRAAGGLEPWRVVVAIQNHDQIGNRMLGERIAALVPREALPLAAATVLLSPCTPLLFMGEEHGEKQPFLYFTSHGDPELAEAVRAGRKREFSSFAWQGEAPDPQAVETFERSRLTPPDADGLRLRETYRELLALRRTLPAGQGRAQVLPGRVVLAQRGSGEGAATVLLHFGKDAVDVDLAAAGVPSAGWRRVWDSHGEASAVPAQIVADGGLGVRLLPWQAVVLRP